MRLAELTGLALAVLGWGREGRSAVAALKRHDPAADITVLVESGELPAHLPGRRGAFGDELKAWPVLIRSPGIPVDHPALVAYRAGGGRVVNPASIWFAERPELPVIGVTGSKGKSTTASLLAALLRSGGREVLLAGNIGVPLLDHLDTRADLVVAELSSYQLSDLQGRLACGLITRLFDEHLDWHGCRDRYFSAKLRLAELLAGGPLIVNAADSVLTAATAPIRGRVLANRAPEIHRDDDALWLRGERLVTAGQLRLVGRHNLDNAALAMAAASRFDVPLAAQIRALLAFDPLGHRLEELAARAGRRWINDSIATSPHATLAALQSLPGQRVVLIAGGLPRPADWAPVIAHLHGAELVGLVSLPDNGPAIAGQLIDAGVLDQPRWRQASNLSEAVATALAISRPGDVVLLSPGAPSFPHFRDFEARGEAFRQAVMALPAPAV